MSNKQTELFLEAQAENCEHCGGIGFITVGEFDDLTEEKCECQTNLPDYE